MKQVSDSSFKDAVLLAVLGCLAFIAVVAVAHYINSYSRKDWRRIQEIKRMFMICMKRMKKNVAELSITIVEMQEVLPGGGNGSDKEPDVLKSRVRDEMNSIRSVLHKDLGAVDAFMRGLETGTELRSLSMDDVERLKGDVRQMQFIATCLKDYFASLESTYEHIDRARDSVQEEASPFCRFRKILQQMMEQISAYEVTESVEKLEGMIRRGFVRYQQYYI